MASIQDAAPAVAGIIGSDPVVAAEEAPAASAVIEITGPGVFVAEEAPATSAVIEITGPGVFVAEEAPAAPAGCDRDHTGPDAIAADKASE